MKSSERQQFITTFLASNGGTMQKAKLMSELLRQGVIGGQNEFDRLVEKLEKHEYVRTEGDQVIYLKTKKAIPSFEDMFINSRSKVEGDVMLTPNAIDGINATVLR
ncbi:MAG: hypothetical protein Q4G58_01095 [bacterium]|nr:hypothetical protein [bacterium]